MKIVILDFDEIRNPLLNAGQARATYEVGQRLAKKGHTFEVISSRFPGSKDRVENGIKYTHIGLGTGNIKINNIAYFMSVPFALRNIRADIIIECFTAPISTLFSPLFTRIPVVVLPSMFNAQEFTKKYHLPFHWIEKFGMRFYKYIMPYSANDSHKAKRYNKNIVSRITSQGVGEEYFRIKHRKAKQILFLGRFDMAQKGIDLLLEAYAKIAHKCQLPLVLAGHGPDQAKIKALIKKLNLSGRVKMVGPTYGYKKKKLIASSAFVAFPSRHEEQSLWSLEALASGLPLVVFDLPEHRWLSTDVTLRAKRFDIDDYASQLLKASNKKFLTRRQYLARNFAKKFTWEKVVASFESFFNEIIKKESAQKSLHLIRTITLTKIS